MASTPSAVVQDVSLVLADAKIRAPWTAERGLKAALSPRSAVFFSLVLFSVSVDCALHEIHLR